MTEGPPSELVAGKYRLTRLLGRGGMGSVWEGIHTTLGNRVACKFIEPEFVQSQDALQRFENEARAAASLRSKHVVDVYDHGVMPDGRPYIVMEFLDGEPLDRRIGKLGTLTLAQTSIIVSQVSRALARAHAAGIVHRDLKPENVFLVWDDEDQTDIAKVVDFGIAKFMSADKGISSSTKTGSILGTPYYMSPEQARGLKNVDSRSDLWSLGVITYEALAGHRPFDGEAVGDLLVHICTSDPTPLSHLRSDLPADIDHWIARALHRDVNQRFQNVRDMADSLSVLGGLPRPSGYGAAASAPSSSNRGAAPNNTYLQVPKLSSGALTNAAMETEVTATKRSSSLPFIFGVISIVAVAGVALAWTGGSRENEEADAVVAAEAPVAPPPASIAATPEAKVMPEPEPTQEAEPISKAKANSEAEPLQSKEAPPELAPPRPAALSRTTNRPPPAPTPSPLSGAAPSPTKAPDPLPAAAPDPAPAPQPAARPSPRPRPKGLDLGY